MKQEEGTIPPVVMRRADPAIVRASPAELRVIRLIAAYKFVKAVSMIVVGIALLHLVHRDLRVVILHWTDRLGLDEGNRFVRRLLISAAHLKPKGVRIAAAVVFSYSALYLVEGIGLWSDRPWAEWLTAIASLGLVPLEIYELYLHPTWARVSIIVANVAIAGYLFVRIARKRRRLAAAAASADSIVS